MIPIYKPYVPNNLDAGISNILYSGQLAFGKYGLEYEQSLCNYIGNDKILTTVTYNHALLIALSVLNLKAGDEIIASPVSCLASNQPFAVKGLKIKWVDIDPATSSIDISKLKKLISNETKAIFNNLFCGYAGELDEIYKIGAEYGIPIIDDCIEGFGTKYNGKFMGNTGADVTVFSFQTVRLPNTIDGGAITFKNNNLYDKAKLIRDYGIDRSNFRLSNGEINPECDIILEGYGATMSEMNSYIGLKQMEDIDSLFYTQKLNAKRWDAVMELRENVVSININKNCEPNYWIYGVLAENKANFIKEMRDNNYYATGVHINNNIYSIFNNKIDLSGVNDFMNKFVALPCGWWFNR
ncbi:DegT/DnrJ/EryC1/StrS family aminotransferase [Elizabethkingia anophelis]|uniref:DegT/DnrJ/EryC1/StrS family aminotransferase n=1 Tax=Elizabethkingia anophelis TaxID=1117645 RepID=UPI0021A9652E|nr:DegT/DnrJ/EryC1/StrS family aminotransferase [Elizabethkingia anophelis]MCT3977715.1 DegT/DnrJ/EryC1/StrS family aminotransferase [Elizabethkingia anophelis]MCT4041330.1 DegT/DnrJ/EryC1/StrS family aminotransferase [Elizabethkingia anophelis]